MFGTQLRITRHTKKTKHDEWEPTEITDNRNRPRDAPRSSRYGVDSETPMLTMFKEIKDKL